MMRRDKHNNLKQSFADDETDDDDDAYFTYRPLSNLPTPPPSSRAPSAAASPFTTPDDGEPLMAKFRGPAIHLVNLIPSSASLTPASVPLVQAILSRAALPIETVALAVCMLDSLSSRFARTWRLSCPLRPGSFPAAGFNKRHTLPPSLPQQPQLHIDSIRPEIIPLAALVLATKFVDDPQERTDYYARAWGRCLWSHEQMNATERCIMESLGYRILPLCAEDCLEDAMVDMQLAARQDVTGGAQPSTPPDMSSEEDFVPSHSRSKTMSTGKAVLGLGLAITPTETPGADTPRAGAYSTDYFDKRGY